MLKTFLIKLDDLILSCIDIIIKIVHKIFEITAIAKGSRALKSCLQTQRISQKVVVKEFSLEMYLNHNCLAMEQKGVYSYTFLFYLQSPFACQRYMKLAALLLL